MEINVYATLIYYSDCVLVEKIKENKLIISGYLETIVTWCFPSFVFVGSSPFLGDQPRLLLFYSLDDIHFIPNFLLITQKNKKSSKEP